MTEMDGSVNPDAGYALIVNYLPPSFTDKDLHGLFSDVGPLYSAKIMRNKLTSTSFGYGFVNFVKKEDAERAIQQKDGEKVLHKQIRVAFSRRGEGPEAIKNANLFVGNLSQSWKESDLEEIFKPYGEVIKSKILIDQLTGISRGCGFILFSKTLEAEAAIRGLDGQIPDGCEKALMVKRNNIQEDSTKIKSAPMTSPKNSSKEVHVIHHYSPYPPFPGFGYGTQSHNATFVSGPSLTEKYSGYATGHEAKYSSYGSAEKYSEYGSATEKYHYGYPYTYGYNGEVTYAVPPVQSLQAVPSSQGSLSGPHASQGGHTLFVYNIGPECTELDLYQLFGPFGAINKTHIQRDLSTGKSKGFGFVTFADREHATRAIANLHGFAWQKNDYRQLQVSFKK